jgi:proteasome-associated ATPase
VGETERHIREIFGRAREKAAEGMPVIVFFDEMESLFRTRGSGVSSDMESTIVPQLLSEIDGVEGLENVLVIGASNRQDMIDPAVLRPGRLDVKIRVERPGKEAAADIFSKYLTADLPIDADEIRASGGGDRDKCVARLIERTVERMYAESTENEFLEVTYQSGVTKKLYFKDFNSGAMTENIVNRAKKAAIKEVIAGGTKGLRQQHLIDAIVDEFKENEDLPNTTNPDDWARISGEQGEKITFVKTLISRKAQAAQPVEDYVPRGQYL